MTPASETGWSARVRHTVPKRCATPDALIEDGEDGDNRILVRAGRGGYWFTSVDTEGTTVEPGGAFKMQSPGRPGSAFAARMKGTIAEAGWSVYASMGFTISDAGGGYDASRYTGVSFMAKGPAHVRFKIPDAYTAPGGGHCTECYNDFGIELALTDKWERYTILFSWMSQQEGWGDPRPEVASNEIYAMQWQVGSRGRSFDIWVDDIEFICGAEGE
jgi:endoglucanase